MPEFRCFAVDPPTDGTLGKVYRRCERVGTERATLLRRFGVPYHHLPVCPRHASGDSYLYEGH